tara:strand:+ start:249 stop:560 length:312 start_codon:yes stop_codon:yes gene_type:complete
MSENLSMFDEVNNEIPKELETRDDVLLWLLDNGVYIHKDSEIDFNTLCNHMDCEIAREAELVDGYGASYKWFEQAARVKVFGFLSQARAIHNGLDFKISLRKK